MSVFSVVPTGTLTRSARQAHEEAGWRGLSPSPLPCPPPHAMQEDATPVPASALGGYQLVFDAVYTPLHTRLLRWAAPRPPRPQRSPCPPDECPPAGRPAGSAAIFNPAQATCPVTRAALPAPVQGRRGRRLPRGHRRHDVCGAGGGPVQAVHGGGAAAGAHEPRGAGKPGPLIPPRRPPGSHTIDRWQVPVV